MSRIAKNPVPLPDGVTAEVKGQTVKVKGPKGELSVTVHGNVTVAIEDGKAAGKKQIRLKTRKEGDKEARVNWGTSWSLVRGAVQGVHKGFTKNLEIQGVGLRAAMQGKTLVMQMGFSHEVKYQVPEGITVAVDKQTKISVSGSDKQRVGQTAAEIRAIKPPEPYKGKGIRYEGEYILMKEGKKK